jgi:L-threonylcarbamoyladenylate synthase
MVHEESIMAVIGSSLAVGRQSDSATSDISVLRSPGMLAKHYSPRAKLILASWRDEQDLRNQLAGASTSVSQIHIISHTRIPLSGEFGRVGVIPHDPEAFARAIYAELHHCDTEGAELIVVELPPDDPEWRAIVDRLRRAAA